MTELHDLSPAEGSTKRSKRLGRGPGSGKGKTAGRGQKGQKARSGGSIPPGFEGGQMPLHRRIPKRGFTPLKRTVYQVVNLRDLNDLDGDEVSRETLRAAGLIGSAQKLVKILGDGDVERAFTVHTDAISASAREKVEAAGGTVEIREAPAPEKAEAGATPEASEGPEAEAAEAEVEAAAETQPEAEATPEVDESEAPAPEPAADEASDEDDEEQA